jgi:AmmeMemoRadiSam system protein B/AmmeMemoRadiSam system protein A
MEMKKRGIILCVVTAFFIIGVFGEESNRDYLTTGNWYPRAPEQLNAMLDSYFNNAEVKPVLGKITGIIGPHAGLIYSGQCAAAAYKPLQNPAAGGHIRRVILLGVSHSSGFYGAAVSTFDTNTTPLGKIPVDTEITKKMAREKHFRVENRIMQQEHSLENHLPFLQKALGKQTYKIVPILFSFLEKKDFKSMAATIKKYIDKNTLVVASSDLTHYGEPFGYTPYKDNLKENLTKLDMGIINFITALDFDGYYAYKEKTAITMCGFVPVGVMMEIFADGKHKGILTDYRKSGDMNNNYSHSVSYGSIIITEDAGKTADKKGGDKKMNASADVNKVELNKMELNKNEQKTLLRIARETLVQYLDKGNYPEGLEEKYDLTENLKEVKGLFVTLKKKGQLRGCIGNIIGQDPLYLGVRDTVIKSAVRDFRFSPVKESELKDIDIEISVMTPLQRLGTDGVIIKLGNYQAVYLPQVATETGWSLDQFLGSLCRKAGLPASSYKESGMEFFIFQAQVFGEHEKGK